MISKIRSTARGFFFPVWSIPVALLVLTLIGYGLRALGLGFFWDDWPYLWFFHRFGPDGILRAFAGDRPFLSFIYITSLSVLGDSSQGWQVFALLARWLCSLGLYWVFALTWPRHKEKAAWAAFLFAIFPGFTQQWIAVIYGQAFFLFAALFFSIGLTLWLARRRRTLARAWLVLGALLALALSAFTMFSTEYFFGLELLRPILLWLVLRDSSPTTAPRSWHGLIRRAGHTARWWAPYLALMLVFIVWRGLIHTFPGYQMTALQDVVQVSPLATLAELALTVVEDTLEVLLVAWGQPLQLGSFLDAGVPAGLRLLGVIVMSALLAAAYLVRLRGTAPAAQPNLDEDDCLPWFERWSTQAVAVGLLAILVSGWPFWLTRLPLRMGFPQDRFTLPLAVGASLVIAGLLDLLLKRRVHKAAVLAVMIGLAVGFHTNTALNYRQDWNTFRDFFWQLTWRAPAVEPDTLFVSDEMPFQYFEDDSLTGPLNWTYDPDGTSQQMDYLLYDLHVRYHNLPDLRSGRAFQKDFRATNFSGSTANMLVFYYSPPGCVRILDPVYDAELYQLPNRLLYALPATNPAELIRDSAEPTAPPAEIFGAEPKHRWCYFFEKADLARQMGDWQGIVEISHDSIRKGFRPEDPAEYLPFIEGYTRLGFWDDAYELTVSAYERSVAVRPALCAVWQRSSAGNGAAAGELSSRGGRFAQVDQLLSCSAR